MVQKILINFANDAFKKSQNKNSKTGLGVGNFDRVIEYSPRDIDKKFYEKNRHILTQLRGCGYWLWKPYIILKTLIRKDVKNGDFIFYADSGSYFIDKIDHIIKLSKKYNQEILPFTDEKAEIEKTRTKKDAFVLMNLDSKEYTDTPQKGAGFILIKKSKETIRFVKEFLKYAEDEKIITDSLSTLGKDYNGFIEHRHDQSIFSLLSKKFKLKAFRHPWQEGNSEVILFKDKYPQIIILTRKNDRTILEKIKYQRSCSKSYAEFLLRLLKMPYRKLLSKFKN